MYTLCTYTLNCTFSIQSVIKISKDKLIIKLKPVHWDWVDKILAQFQNYDTFFLSFKQVLMDFSSHLTTMVDGLCTLQ